MIMTKRTLIIIMMHTITLIKMTMMMLMTIMVINRTVMTLMMKATTTMIRKSRRLHFNGENR